MRRHREQFRQDLGRLIPRLRRFGQSLTGSSADADDLVQDALEKALKLEDQFDPRTRLDSWMFRIMQTTWIDNWRKSKVRTQRTAEYVEDFTTPSIDGRAAMGARLDLERTQAAIDTLSPELRATLLLVAVEGMTYREAAETLDVPIGTIMSRVSKARAHLMKKLTTDEQPNLKIVS